MSATALDIRSSVSFTDESDIPLDSEHEDFSLELAASVFTTDDEAEQVAVWKQADMAQKVLEYYGRHQKDAVAGVRAFAGMVGRTVGTLQKYARASRFFPVDEILEEKYPGRLLDVFFSMYRIAANHCIDPIEARAALQEAIDAGWKCEFFRKVLVSRHRERAKGRLDVDVESNQVWINGKPLAQMLKRLAGLRVEVLARMLAEEEE